MMTVLKLIIKIIYEPIFYVALTGFMLLVALNFRQNWRKLCFGLIIAFVMLYWRFEFDIRSERYAAIFIFPAIMLTVYFFYQAKWMKWKLPLPVSRFLILVCIVTCLAQTLHFNFYNTTPIKIAQLLAADARNYLDVEVICLAGDSDLTRYEYYSGLQIYPNTIRSYQHKVFESSSSIAENYDGNANALYFIIKHYSHQNAEEILGSYIVGMEKIYSNYDTNKKKKITSLFRYIPEKKRSKKPFSAKEITQYSDDTIHLLRNGDFEVSAKSEELPDLLERFVGKFDQREPYPQNWWLAPHGDRFKDGSNFSIKLSDDAISGKYSLYMKAYSPIGISSGLRYKAEDLELSFLIRGRQGSRFGISLGTWMPTGTFGTNMVVYDATLDNEEIVKCTVELKRKYYPESSQITPGFLLYDGEIWLDEIRIKPVAEGKDNAN